MYIFEKCLKTVDYFGKPVQITFDKQKKFRTPIGGFLSIVIFCLVLSLIITNGLNLLNRKQPKTSVTSINEFEAPHLNLTKSKKMFAAYFLTKEYVPFFDPSYFNFEIFQFKVIRNNVTTEIASLPLTIKNCSIYFENLKEKKFENQFLQNDLKQAICFDTDERDLVLGGKFIGDYFSNIYLKLNRCKNQTNLPNRILNEDNMSTSISKIIDNPDINSNKPFRRYFKDGKKYIYSKTPNNNDISISQYKPDKFIPNHSQHKVSIFIDQYKIKNNQLVDSTTLNDINLHIRNLTENGDEQVNSKDNNEDKYSSSIKSKNYYEKKNIVCKSNEEINRRLQGGYFDLFFIDQNIDLNNFAKPVQDFFSDYFILLDPGSRKFVDLYFKSVNITSDDGIIFESQKVHSGLVFDYYREQMETSINSENIIELYINSSKNVLKYSIFYLKFQDFAANIGGLMNVMLQIGMFITMIFNDHKMEEKIINTLFDLSKIDNEQLNSDKKFFKNNINLEKPENKKVGLESKLKTNCRKKQKKIIFNNFCMQNAHNKNNSHDFILEDIKKRSTYSCHCDPNDNNDNISKINEKCIQRYRMPDFFDISHSKSIYKKTNIQENFIPYSNEIALNRENNRDEYENKTIDNRYFRNSDAKSTHLRNRNIYLDKSTFSKTEVKRGVKLHNDFRDLYENPKLFELSAASVEKDKRECKLQDHAYDIKSLKSTVNNIHNFSAQENKSKNCENINKNREDNIEENIFRDKKAHESNTEIKAPNPDHNPYSGIKSFKIEKNIINENDDNSMNLFKKNINVINNDKSKENIFNLSKLNILKKLPQQKFKFSFFEIIVFYVCPCLHTNKFNNKKGNFNYLKLRLFKFMDFLEIVNHLQESSKLKKIILSKEQLDIFNVHHRQNTRVSIFDEYTEPSFSKSRIKDDSYYLRLLVSYKKLLDDSQDDIKIKNLIKYMDQDIKKVFDEILVNQ